jgi:Histidine kinase/Histidine kinase-, DNA gyrase B-, and HSP90-like ATPase
MNTSRSLTFRPDEPDGGHNGARPSIAPVADEGSSTRPSWGLRAHSLRQWLRVLTINLIVAVSVGAVLVLAGKPLVSTVVISLVYANVIGVGAALVLPRLMGRMKMQGGGRPWFVLPTALLGMAAVGALLIGLTATWLGVLPGADLWQVVWPSLGIAAVIALSLGVAIALHESTRAQRAEVTVAQRTVELARAKAERSAIEARLAMLEARLEPHFLFNTLNTIVDLIHVDPAGADRLVRRLGDLLLFTLERRDRRTVRLDNELEVARAFLEIQASRFDRLSYGIDVPPDLAGCEVPPFALQTVVENSVRHVAERRLGPTRLRVTAGVVGNTLELGVWDDGPGFSLDGIPTGRGLDTLRQRLETLYGAAGGLRVDRREEGTMVTIWLPVSVAVEAQP